MKTKIRALCGATALLLAPLSVFAQPPLPRTPYVWKNVIMGGGGNVPGIVMHPKVPDLAYIRTDVGGSYRWDKAGEKWIPL